MSCFLLYIFQSLYICITRIYSLWVYVEGVPRWACGSQLFIFFHHVNSRDGHQAQRQLSLPASLSCQPEEMPHSLKALVALPEDPSLFPSTHMGLLITARRREELTPSRFYSHTYTCVNTHTKIKINLKN